MKHIYVNAYFSCFGMSVRVCAGESTRVQSVHYGGATCQLPAKARSKSPGERQRLGRTVSEAVRRAGSAAFAQRLPVPVDTPEDPRAEGTSPPTRSGVGLLRGRKGRGCHVERSPRAGRAVITVDQLLAVAADESSVQSRHGTHGLLRSCPPLLPARRCAPAPGRGEHGQLELAKKWS